MPMWMGSRNFFDFRTLQNKAKVDFPQLNFSAGMSVSFYAVFQNFFGALV